MNFKALFSLAAVLPMLLCGAELWSSKNWKSAKADGAPNGEWFFDERGGSAKFTPATGNNPAFVTLNLDNGKTNATLTCKEPVKFPKDSELTIAGEYRTVNYVPGKGGTLIANIAYNYGTKDQKWQCAFLKSTDGEWKSFTNTKKIDVEATGSFRTYFYIKGESGSVEWRNLSLTVKSPGNK